MKIKIEEDLEFDFQKFKWNKYELNDGTIIKAVYLPTKVFRSGTDEFGTPQYITGGQVHVTAHIPMDLRQTPSNERFDPAIHPTTQIDFIAIEEPWNIYDLSDGNELKVRLIVSAIRKAEFINPFGEPAYNIQHSLTYAAKVNHFD